MKRLCKNCDYWKPDVVNIHGVLTGKCLKAGEYDIGSNTPAYWDSESYSGFCAGENFGCIHFMKKQTN